MPHCCSPSIGAPLHKHLHINHSWLDVHGRRLGSTGLYPRSANQADVHVFKLRGAEEAAAHSVPALDFCDLQKRNRCIQCWHTKQKQRPCCSSHCLMARQGKWSGMSRQNDCSDLRTDVFTCLSVRPAEAGLPVAAHTRKDAVTNASYNICCKAECQEFFCAMLHHHAEHCTCPQPSSACARRNLTTRIALGNSMT